MTAMRFKGWQTDGTLKVPAEHQEAIADMAADLRDLTAEKARLGTHSTALRALLDAITRHGPGSEQANDAYREGLRAINATP